MKTIGLLGGMSWESTTSYYQAINLGVKHSLGNLHSAKITMVSVDFAEIEEMQMSGDWDGAANILSAAAQNIEAGGADFLLICTNTMHKVADEIASTISIPLLHIADATATLIIAKGYKKVGLLGTAFTMEEDFYKGRLQDKHGLEVIIPEQNSRKIVHDVIYDELCLGKINDRSRSQYIDIINELYERGAEAIILGCTEIALLVSSDDTDVPLIDTTQVHAEEAVKAALA